MRICGRRRGTAVAASSLATLALTAAGCGGSDSPPAKLPVVTQAPPSGPRLHAGPARPRDVAVIRSWADTLRAGQVSAAARFFAIPALVENNTPLLALDSVRAVRAFNGSLPCGARLLEARRTGQYTIATFLLTERPGGDCGPGTGARAATAFRLRAGKIVEWHRVPVPIFAPPATPKPKSSPRV